MIEPAASLLANVCRSPETSSRLSLGQWDLLIRQARAANVLARVALDIEALGLTATVPAAPRQHLMSAMAVARRHRQSAAYEIDAVRHALQSTGVVPVFLKGAAYQVCNLVAARGRLYADIDLLVPRESLPLVESELIRAGWQSSDPDAYTQRYYRQWMHELPPLRHLQRATTLDVHHTILPPTAGRRLDARRLIERAVQAPGAGGAQVLAPVDMVLHSAAHLFYDGELEHGFRDLVDLHSLLGEFASRDPRLWRALLPRARELDLERPLYYALRCLVRFGLAAPPADIVTTIAGPSALVTGLMDGLFDRALSPHHASCSDALTPLAKSVLYVRAHWLRMPVHLLAYHLTRKALTRPPQTSDEGEGQAQ